MGAAYFRNHLADHYRVVHVLFGGVTASGSILARRCGGLRARASLCGELKSLAASGESGNFEGRP